MKPMVHILAACRNIALLDATLLVFKTLRTGFPSARVHVWANQLEYFAQSEVNRLAGECGCAVHQHFNRLNHDAWLEMLIQSETQPFWVLDTDVVFFDSLEGFPGPEDELLGRWQPAFLEEWTHTKHVERLEPACLYVHPQRLRAKMAAWMDQFPRLWAGAQTNLVRQQFIPRQSGVPLFYDTAAGLWHAGMGRRFTTQQDAVWEHLHCGVYADQVAACKGLKDIQAVHARVCANPQLARELRPRQERYYQEHAAV